MKKQKIIYIKTPKTAGTALTGILKKEFPHFIEIYIETKKWPSKESIEKANLIILGEVIAKKFKKKHPEVWEQASSFAIVRNPYDKTISAWKYCKTTKNKSLHNILSGSMPRNKFWTKDNHDYIHFTLSQAHCLIENNHPIVDKIFRFEDITKQPEELFSYLQLTASSFLPHKNPTKNRTGYDLKSLSQPILDLIYQHYYDDFHHFNYPPLQKQKDEAKTVIFVIDSLGTGGAEKVVLTLAEEFTRQGNQAHVITIRNHVVYDIPEGVIYHSMNFKKGLGLYRMLTDYNMKRKLLKKIKQIDQDTPVFGLFSHLIFSDTTLLNEQFSFPVLTTIHNTYSSSLLRDKNGLDRKYKKYKLQRIYNGKHIITVSKGIQDDLTNEVGIQPASCRVIYNPFNFEEIRELAKRPLEATHYKDYIIHVGRFSPQKRHDILLKAFQRADIDCHLVLLGTGSKEDRLQIEDLAEELGIKKQLVMPGFTKNPYQWMKNAKLMVVSSDFEGFCLVLVESLIVGTPVVSTDCPSGPSEILCEQPELLSPVGDIEALAKNIRTYYQASPEVLDKNIERFSASVIVHQLKEAVIEISGIHQHS